jgi:branched-chain amino acid transport system substrate-binding protein
MSGKTLQSRGAHLPRRRMRLLRTLALPVVALIVGVAALPSAGASTAKYPAPSGGNGGATAPGVTSSAINLALDYSITGPSPGATAGALRGTQAYLDYINSIGGIYGRKLHITAHDDGFDPTKAAANCEQIIPKDFAIVGGFGTGDAGCYPSVKSSGIPWVQFAYDPQLETLPNVYFFGAESATKEPDGSYQEMKNLFPKVKKVAVVWTTDAPGNGQEAAHIEVGLKKVGYQVSYSEGLNVALPTFTNYAVAIRNSGAQAVFFDAGDAPSDARLSEAFAQEGFKPAFQEAATTYASYWKSLAGASSTGWVQSLPYAPYLDPAALQATPGGQLLATWFPKANPGQTIDLFAMFGWTDTAILVQGLINAGPRPTRANVLAAIHKLTSFDAGGLYPPTNIGQKKDNNCLVFTESTPTGYKQLAPKKIGTFDCSIPGAQVLNTPGVPS